MEGTFSTVPPQFAQLYTVHGLSQGRHVIGAYGLLPNKRLDQIQGFTNFANPQSVMIDFEQSVRSSERLSLSSIQKFIQTRAKRRAYSIVFE